MEPDVPIENNLASDLQLIVPNLHRRYSGVTATNRMVAPKLATMYRAAWLGPHAPDGIARMGFADLLKLWRRRNSLIWHARRNDEMIAGLLLRALGWPLETRLHLGRTAASQAADALADPADGCGDRHFRTVGVVSQARGDGGDAWRRYRRATHRRPTARRRLRKPNCRGVTRSAASAGCARKRARTSSWRRCAGCCRAIPISPPSSSARWCRSSRVLPTV